MPRCELVSCENKKIDLSSSPWTMHEFFAGSGLVAYGLRGMFTPIWSNDISQQKKNVYDRNFESKHFLLDDIKNVSGKDLPFAHLSWASFPCQDLSLAGAIGGIDARRSGLVWEWLRVLDEMSLKPRILLVENVSGLLSASKGDNYRKLHKALNDRGYRCGAIVLNASVFLPQSRPRVFVIAIRHGMSIPSELIGEKSCWLHNETTRKIGESLSDWIWWQAEKPLKRQSCLEDIIEKDVPFDKDDVLRLISDRHKDILNKHGIVYATGYRRMRHGKQQLELRFDGIAGCLRTPEGGSSKQFLVVKNKEEIHARLLTVREAARLMGAPDSFVLPGSYNDGYKAMGDAVAVPVAKFIGEKFLMRIAEAAYKNDY